MEILMADNSAYFFGDTLHVLENLFELGDELTLGWFESHILSCKTHSCLNTVLLLVVLLVHLGVESGYLQGVLRLLLCIASMVAVQICTESDSYSP